MAHQRSTFKNDAAFVNQRLQMVEEQLRSRHIRDEAVLTAMANVPRHRFVPSELISLAYTNQPLPIGYQQTISQPYVVAYMLEAAKLQPDHRVLEIGAGSGYEAALLGELVAEVYTIEIVPALARQSRQLLQSLGYRNVHVKTGDGHLGWPQHAPYDAIIVTAAPRTIPKSLLQQVAPHGRVVIPVGRIYQDLLILESTPDGFVEHNALPVRFVPMTRQTQSGKTDHAHR